MFHLQINYYFFQWHKFGAVIFLYRPKKALEEDKLSTYFNLPDVKFPGALAKNISAFTKIDNNSA